MPNTHFDQEQGKEYFNIHKDRRGYLHLLAVVSDSFMLVSLDSFTTKRYFSAKKTG